MKHLFNLTAILLLLFVTSCKKERLSANGNLTSETRNIGTFYGIHTSGNTPVHIVYGNEHKVLISGSSNLIPYFESKIINGKVYLAYERINVRDSDIEVTVTMPFVKNISLSGSAKINISGNFQSVDLMKLDVSGSGDLILASPINTTVAELQISGSGDIRCEKLTAERADVNISGSGNANITASDRLKATISGSGKIYYGGNPTVESHISGSGKVIKL